jgi:hypothetical protein
MEDSFPMSDWNNPHFPTSNSTADKSFCIAYVLEPPSTPTSKHCFIRLNQPFHVSTIEPPFYQSSPTTTTNLLACSVYYPSDRV